MSTGSPRGDRIAVAVIGTGNLGSGLAWRLHHAGHPVVLGSRDAVRGRAMGAEMASGGGSRRTAASRAEVIILAVPWHAVPAAVADLGDVAGKIIVDPTNPTLEEAAGRPAGGNSGAEMLAALLPHSHIVKAFNHVEARVIHLSPEFPRAASVFLCGDHEPSKREVGRLATAIGLEPVDAGPLRAARELEAVGALMLRLGAERAPGPDLALGLLRAQRT